MLTIAGSINGGIAMSIGNFIYRVVRINGETFVSAEDQTTKAVIMKVNERFIRAHARELF
jgi:hypothetical protein